MNERLTIRDFVRWCKQGLAEAGVAGEILIGPAVSFRRRILRRMLAIDPGKPGQRLFELGSGTGQFASEYCRAYPALAFLGLVALPE